MMVNMCFTRMVDVGCSYVIMDIGRGARKQGGGFGARPPPLGSVKLCPEGFRPQQVLSLSGKKSP